MSLVEADEAASYVQELAGDNANIIFGAIYDETATDSVTITVIATGIEDVNVNTAMAKFSPKAQATQGVGQTVKPAVKASIYISGSTDTSSASRRYDRCTVSDTTSRT